MKDRWIGHVELGALPAQTLAEVTERLLPGTRPDELQPLSGGFRNWNFKVDTAAGPRVLRVYATEGDVAWKEQRIAAELRPNVRSPQYLEIQTIGPHIAALREFRAGHPTSSINSRGELPESLYRLRAWADHGADS